LAFVLLRFSPSWVFLGAAAVLLAVALPGLWRYWRSRPGRVRWLAPMPGEHNEEIFCGLLGHSKDDLARWREDGVV